MFERGRRSRWIGVAGAVLLALLTWTLLDRQQEREAGGLSDEARLLASNAKDPKVAASLEATALDPDKTTSLRYVALRRLEDQAPAQAVSVAEKLASLRGEDKGTELLRANAVAVLVRSKDPTAAAALARSRSAAPGNDDLATHLTPAAHGAGGH